MIISSYYDTNILHSDLSGYNKNGDMDDKYNFEEEYFKTLDEIHGEDKNSQTIIQRTHAIIK